MNSTAIAERLKAESDRIDNLVDFAREQSPPLWDTAATLILARMVGLAGLYIGLAIAEAIRGEKGEQ